MRFSLSSCFLFFCLLSVHVIAQETPPDNSPFGICAHLQRGEEHNQMPKNLELMQKAGIRWVRADFSWNGVENPQGNWRFDHLDRVVAETNKHGIQVLPILNYDVPWATPAYKHIDKWLIYVEKIVSRYKDQIKYWEVWNEPNLKGFWRDEPSGENYKILLEATYKKIKSIDPKLIVLYGGTAGIPFEFIEDSLKAGAADYFDEFNIHPYRSGMTSNRSSERYYKDLEKLRQLLAKYKADHKPIWITEFGWATPPGNSQTSTAIFKRTKQILDPTGKDWTIAVLIDGNYQVDSIFQTKSKEAVQRYFPAGYKAEIISLDDLKGISPAKYDALFLPPSECYPTPFIDDMVNYVTKGGKLFLFGGVPLYYKTAFSKEMPGVLERVSGQNTDADRKRLRIGWIAWWTDPAKKTPENAPLFIPDDMKPLFDNTNFKGQATRFLTGKLLKDGDKLIPLLDGQKYDFKEPCAGIFQFDSDMKGAVIVNTLMGESVITTEEDQGIFLAQAYLLSLRFGIKRYFWYEFQAPERDNLDKEHHFGIVHQQLEPKPAYHVLAALTKLFTDGSVMDTETEWNRDGFITIRWKQKDGTNVWAVWSPDGSKKVPVKIGAGFKSAQNYLGETLPIKQSDTTLPLESGVMYLIGPQTLEF